MFLFYTTVNYCWFINLELVANSTLTQVWTKHISHTCFLCKALHSLLALRNITRHFSTTLGGHFNRQNHQQKAHKYKSTALNRPCKDTCLEYEKWNKKAECHLVPLSWARVRRRTHVSIATWCTRTSGRTDTEYWRGAANRSVVSRHDSHLYVVFHNMIRNLSVFMVIMNFMLM